MSVVAPESYVEVAEVSKIYRSGTADAVEAVGTLWHSTLSITYSLRHRVTHQDAAM